RWSSGHERERSARWSPAWLLASSWSASELVRGGAAILHAELDPKCVGRVVDVLAAHLVGARPPVGLPEVVDLPGAGQVHRHKCLIRRDNDQVLPELEAQQALNGGVPVGELGEGVRGAGLD